MEVKVSHFRSEANYEDKDFHPRLARSAGNLSVSTYRDSDRYPGRDAVETVRSPSDVSAVTTSMERAVAQHRATRAKPEPQG